MTTAESSAPATEGKLTPLAELLPNGALASDGSFIEDRALVLSGFDSLTGALSNYTPALRTLTRASEAGARAMMTIRRGFKRWDGAVDWAGKTGPYQDTIGAYLNEWARLNIPRQNEDGTLRPDSEILAEVETFRTAARKWAEEHGLLQEEMLRYAEATESKTKLGYDPAKTAAKLGVKDAELTPKQRQAIARQRATQVTKKGKTPMPTFEPEDDKVITVFGRKPTRKPATPPADNGEPDSAADVQGNATKTFTTHLNGLLSVIDAGNLKPDDAAAIVLRIASAAAVQLTGPVDDAEVKPTAKNPGGGSAVKAARATWSNVQGLAGILPQVLDGKATKGAMSKLLWTPEDDK